MKLRVILMTFIAVLIQPHAFARTKARTPMTSPTRSIVLGGGCFWGVQDLIRTLPGVTHTEVGYSGGVQPEPTYADVKTGTTGHAEVVRITYEPKVIHLSKILDFFFRLHDPTTRDRQGNDRGTQYRSIAFYDNLDEKREIEAAIARANQSGRWKNPVVTQTAQLGPFYLAEEYHQDYLIKNPGGYTCHYIRD